MFNLRLTDEMKEAEIIFSWAVQGGEDGGTPAIYNPKYRSQCNRWYSDIYIYICLNKIRSIVYSHTMGKKMLNMRKSNIPPHQLKLQKNNYMLHFLGPQTRRHLGYLNLRFHHLQSRETGVSPAEVRFPVFICTRGCFAHCRAAIIAAGC